MKRAFAICVFLFFSYSVFAQRITEGRWGQPWLDIANAAAACSDGGYIITGLTYKGLNDPHGDIFVVKLDDRGSITWTRTFGGPNLEGGNSVIQTADGGYMVAGHTEDFGARDCDAFLLKLDKDGNQQWIKVYGGEFDDISDQVQQLPDGGYVVAGITASYGNNGLDGNRHIYFIRTDNKGELSWTKYYGGAGIEYSYSIAAMPQGGFLAVGFTTSRGKGEHDALLMQLDNNGDTISTTVYANSGDSRFYQILNTEDKGYIMAGYTTGTSGKPEGFAVKLNADGKELWRKTYGSLTTGVILRGAAEQPNGDLTFTGVSYAADTAGNVYILTTDNSGNIKSEELCGGTASIATCIASQGNNGYLVAGATAYDYGDNGDMYYRQKDFTSSGISTVAIDLPQVYPNPVTDKAAIILPRAEAYQTVQIAVRNMEGRAIWRADDVSGRNIIIDTHSFDPGAYLFSIVCKDGNKFKGKFVVE